MSRAALELEQAIKDMRAKAAKEQRGAKGRQANTTREAVVEQKENQLTNDSDSDMTGSDLSEQQAQAAGGNDAAGAGNSEEGKKQNMAKSKKSTTKKAPKAKAPKAAKPAKVAKAAGERKPREKKLASGRIKKIEASGTTYLRIEFEEGAIMLTPTGNREQNRDIAVKALRALL